MKYEDRSFRLRPGVWVTADPNEMSVDELEDTVHSLADFASRLLSEKLSLTKILQHKIDNDTKGTN